MSTICYYVCPCSSGRRGWRCSSWPSLSVPRYEETARLREFAEKSGGSARCGRLADVIKRSFDLGCSAIGLIILAPILVLLAIWIKLEDGGPILYSGTRVGRFGRPFQMLKFRTMVVNAERLGGPSTADHDPRITRCGRFLRKRKLDEVPQLINVLRGEMSIVGPRPEVPFYVNLFSDEEKAILSVRPGITDWASLWNSDEGAVLHGSADPERAYMERIRPEKIRLQLAYVRNQSLLVDLGIIAQTVLAVLTKRRPQALGAAH